MTVRAALPMLVTLSAGGSAHAEERRWTFEFEPIYMKVYGHDPHVLTIHEIDLDSTPPRDSKSAVSLDTDSARVTQDLDVVYASN